MNTILLINSGGSANRWQAVVRAAFGEEPVVGRMSKDQITTFDDVLSILQHSYDLILLPLTLPNWNSLRIVETAHDLQVRTRLVLCSGTMGAEWPLEQLFDAFIRSDKLTPQTLLSACERPISRDPIQNRIPEKIGAVLRGGYLMEWADPYQRYISAHEMMHDSVIRAQARRVYQACNANSGPPKGEAGGHVFISYAREDAMVAEFIAAELKNAGFDVWIDTGGLLPGQDWELEIKKAIDGAAAMIILLSQASVHKSGYVHDEVHLGLCALERSNPEIPFLIPVRLDDCVPVHHRLRRIQHLDMRADPEMAIGKLVKALRAIPGLKIIRKRAKRDP